MLLQTFFIFFVLCLDQLTKMLASAYKGPGLSLFDGLLSFSLIKNKGIAFSMPLEGLFLQVITLALLIALCFVFVYSHKRDADKWESWGYACLLGGAAGNAFDRIFVGSVTDFISLKHFAIFNFADIMVTVGVILLLISVLSCYQKTKTTSVSKKK